MLLCPTTAGPWRRRSRKRKSHSIDGAEAETQDEPEEAVSTDDESIRRIYRGKARKLGGSAGVDPTPKKKGPRRPLTAYTAFVREVRPSIMLQYPDKPFQAVAALVGRKWKALSVKQRAPYIQTASADSERFQREKLDMLIADGFDSLQQGLSAGSCSLVQQECTPWQGLD